MSGQAARFDESIVLGGYAPRRVALGLGIIFRYQGAIEVSGKYFGEATDDQKE